MKKDEPLAIFVGGVVVGAVLAPMLQVFAAGLGGLAVAMLPVLIIMAIVGLAAYGFWKFISR